MYSKATQDLLLKYNKQFTWEVKVQLMGMKEHDSAKKIIELLELPMTIPEYMSQIQALLKAMLPTVSVMPGVEKLVRHLHDHNVPMAVATGSDQWGYDLKIVNHRELFSAFHHVVLSSNDPDVHLSKPAPDCFLVAARRFEDSPSPENVLAFEDAPNGVLSAHAAGMQCVWVPDSRADKSAYQDKACLILNTLEEFEPTHFGLPAFKS